jgi:hypothetical protein
MRKGFALALLAAALTFVSYAQENSQKLDCPTFLQGTRKPLGKDYEPPKMSEDGFEIATSSRVCIMTFVQIDAIRPLLKQDPKSAAKLAHIDELYKLKDSLPKGPEQDAVDNKLTGEIHELFSYVASQDSERLRTIADGLRNSKAQVRKQGYSPLQAELMARYLQVLALQREGRSAEIRAVVDELRANAGAGSLIDDGMVDRAEKGTYFRADTLWSAITAYELKAEAVQNSGKPEVVSIVAKYLDIPQSSLSITNGPELSEFMQPLTKSMKAAATSTDGVAALRSLQGVAGAADSGSHVDVYVESKAGLPARVFRYSRASGRVEILDATSTFQTDIGLALTRYSTPQMRLVSVVRAGDQYAIQVAGKSFMLSSGELQTLRNGDPLASEHPLSRELLARDSPFVLYSNPLMHDRSPYLKEAEDVGFAIQHAYPSVQVFRDDFNPRVTPERVRSIEDFRVGDTSRIVAVVAEDSFRVDDKRLIQNIQATLSARGVAVKLWKSGQTWDGGSGKGVIVVTGHIDNQLADFVRQLGSAGVFKGNYVVFGSCYGDLSSALIREINTEFQAVGTFRFEGKISPYALQDFVTDLTDRISHGQGEFGFSPVLQKSARLADVSGIWTVCQVQLEAIDRG